MLRRKTWGALVSHNPAELNLPGVLFSLSAELFPRTGSDVGLVAAEEAEFKWYRPLVCVFVPLTFKEEMLLGAGAGASSFVSISAAAEGRGPQK